MATTRITYRNMDSSPSVDTDVRQRAAKLESHFSDLTDCHVVIELPHRRQQKGAHFRVLIELAVPGKTLVVSNEDGTDAHVTIHEAFRHAHRELERWRDERRGAVKTHTGA
jgi:ribosomal subunit interface protein